MTSQLVASGATSLARYVTLALTVIMLVAAPSPAGPTSDIKAVGHVSVQGFADRSAVAAGETLNLAVSLKMDKGWYIYWQNPGPLGGLPTEVEWTVPAGYQVGRTRYPVPHLKYDKILKGDANIYPGEAVFLTPVRVPKAVEAGKEATFTVKASWLVCEKSCIPGQAQISLTLPVVAKAETVKQANEKVFEQAAEALPVPSAKAEHLKLSGTAGQEAVKPGDKFTVHLTAEVEAKHHMQSHKPLQEGLIPAVVFMERTDGLEIGEVKYPEGQVRQDRILGKLSEYSGKVVFRIPVTVADDADKAPRWIRGFLQSQICTDAGTCYPPQFVEFAIPVRMEGGEKPGDADAFVAPVEKPEPLAGKEPSTKPAEAKPSQQTATPSASPSTTGIGEAPSTIRTSSLQRIEEWFTKFGYIGVLALALIGGVILNLMPCVLPVISLKILSFVRQAKEDRARIFLLGVTYCAGILVFFGFIAILFWARGEGWGQLFQDPYVVLGLAAIVTAFAMSLFGVFAVFTPRVINELGQMAEEREGLSSAFFTGVLATFLGTACTAPFLSAAVGAATRFPAGQGALIFFTVGIGMALPFLILAAKPGWLKFVPKPGPWMGVFEQLMGFLLLGTAIWLLNPLRGQLGDYGLLLSLVFLLGVAIAVWIIGKIQFGDPPGRKLRLHAVALLVLILGWILPFHVLATIPRLVEEQAEQQELVARGQAAVGTDQYGHTKLPDYSKGIPWEHYKRRRALADVEQGYTVFVDYTASWCANCKVNKKTSIEQADVMALMQKYNVIPYEADYTLPMPEIKEDLKRFKRGGVPLYLVYKPGDPNNPEVLPEILTPTIVIDALKRAGPSHPKPPNSP
ncbi:MAG TPA: protein-disulfide reductase DsbD domain-containing protein [Phycisphaerae bacterium]|nr:protein-disulfide reductase DsbD domain-containing protein [Phycisphaerae bacterium]